MIDFNTDVVAEYKLAHFGILSKDLRIWMIRFLRSKESEISKKTKKSYIHALRTFYDFAKQYDKHIGIEKISERFINHYLMWYQTQLAQKSLHYEKISEREFKKIKNAPKSKRLGRYDSNFEVHEKFESSLLQRSVILKSFFSYVSSENREQVDFLKMFTHVKKIKVQEKMTDYLTPRELEATIGYLKLWTKIYKDHLPKSSERYAYRNSMLLLMYCLTGARTEELLWVRKKDIKVVEDEDGVEFYVVNIMHGKGGKRRKVAFEKKHLQEHIEYMNSELPSDKYYYSSTYVDGKYTNKKMSDKTIRDFQNMIMKLQGFNKSGLHTIRRGYATKRIGDDKIQIAEVAKELGNTVAILEEHYFKNNEDALIRNKKSIK